MKIEIVDELERGIAYGEACFETFRVIDGQVFAWAKHMSRLAAGLKEFGVSLTDDDIRSIAESCLLKAAEKGSDTLVRLTVSGGTASWGLLTKAASPRVYIQVMPYHNCQPSVSLSLKQWPFPLKKKAAKFTSDYAETLRAISGSEDIHVLFEKNGLLIAAATANMLLYRQGEWCTPKADAGILPGMVREYLLQNALVKEIDCPVLWLADCEAVALCNSGQFIQPVAAVQGYGDYDVSHHAIESLKSTLNVCDGVRV